MTDQKWPDNLLIVRHGKSQRNHDREMAKKQGQRADFSDGVRDQDTPLVPIGQLQCLSLGVALNKSFPGHKFHGVE